MAYGDGVNSRPTVWTEDDLGRYPANVIMDKEAAALLDEQSGITEGSGEPSIRKGKSPNLGRYGIYGKSGIVDGLSYNDSGGASRYFHQVEDDDPGRWPANVIMDEDAAKELDKQSGDLAPAGNVRPAHMTPGTSMFGIGGFDHNPNYHPDGGGGASRFFYCPKASREEREMGLENIEPAKTTWQENFGAFQDDLNRRAIRNIHPCLLPGSLVLTDHGWQEIEKIQIRDQVYASDGAFHSVTDVSSHDYAENAYTIGVSGTNIETTATHNHPFLIWRPVKKRNAIIGGSVQWLEASELKTGDYTLSPVYYGHHEGPQPDRSLDYWFVVGLWLAEGTVHNGNCKFPSFSLHSKETYLIDRIRRICPNTRVYKHGTNGVQVIAMQKGLVEDFVRLCGRGSRWKRLDPSVLGLCLDEKRALFDGYIAGDGSRVRGHIQTKTASRALAGQLRLLAESIGYTSAAYYNQGNGNKHFGKRVVKDHGHWQLYFSQINWKRVNDDRKPTRPTIIKYKGHLFTLHRIKKIVRQHYDGLVWNLTVNEAHTFQTIIGMSHNTVKPIKLMQYLIKLVTPRGGLVLDPFLGSGTTLIACRLEGMAGVGIEKNPDYEAIIHGRINALPPAIESFDPNAFSQPVPSSTGTVQVLPTVAPAYAEAPDPRKIAKQATLEGF